MRPITKRISALRTAAKELRQNKKAKAATALLVTAGSVGTCYQGPVEAYTFAATASAALITASVYKVTVATKDETLKAVSYAALAFVSMFTAALSVDKISEAKKGAPFYMATAAQERVLNKIATGSEPYTDEVSGTYYTGNKWREKKVILSCDGKIIEKMTFADEYYKTTIQFSKDCGDKILTFVQAKNGALGALTFRPQYAGSIEKVSTPAPQ